MDVLDVRSDWLHYNFIQIGSAMTSLYIILVFDSLERDRIRILSKGKLLRQREITLSRLWLKRQRSYFDRLTYTHIVYLSSSSNSRLFIAFLLQNNEDENHQNVSFLRWTEEQNSSPFIKRRFLLIKESKWLRCGG